jgi:hypothetical protein
MIRTRQIDVHLGFFAGGRVGKPKLPVPRRGASLLGIFAILLQATLFAWHHHPFPLSSRNAPVVVAAPVTSPEAPGQADTDCQICFALAHHSAASPADFTAASPPRHLLLRLPAIPTALAPAAASYLLFRSRAPPRA